MMTIRRVFARLTLGTAALVGAVFVLFYFPGLYWFGASIAVELLEVRETVEHEMRWSHADALPSGYKQPHIVLEFVEFPGFSQRLSGSSLEKHLRELESETVTTEFVVTKVLGRTSSYRLDRVGDVRWPAFTLLGGGRRGPPRQAPFGKPLWWFL